VKQYEITHMIIDEESNGDEHVTVDFTHNNNNYCVTFNKNDLETINTWMIDRNATIPANLSNDLIESIRGEIKKRI
jgi:hypothetical protein